MHVHTKYAVSSHQDGDPKQLKHYFISGCSMSRNEIPQDITPKWTFKDDWEMIEGIIMKGR